MNNKDFEPIRIRIMQEAYNLADEGSVDGYNAVKVMCGDVQKMLPPQREWVGLTDEERKDIALEVPMDAVLITEALLKEKNNEK